MEGLQEISLLPHWAECPGKDLTFSKMGTWEASSGALGPELQLWDFEATASPGGRIPGWDLDSVQAHCCSSILTSGPCPALVGKPGALDVIWDVTLTPAAEEQRAIMSLLWEAVEVGAKGWLAQGWPDPWLVF